jgi:hypothetical protein
VSESFVCGSQPEIKEELTKQMPGIPLFGPGDQRAARLAKHLVAKDFSLLDTATSTPVDSRLH